MPALSRYKGGGKQAETLLASDVVTCTSPRLEVADRGMDGRLGPQRRSGRVCRGILPPENKMGIPQS